VTAQLWVILFVLGVALLAFVIPRRRLWAAFTVLALVAVLVWALGAV
jgi:hypothetical protein